MAGKAGIRNKGIGVTAGARGLCQVVPQLSVMQVRPRVDDVVGRQLWQMLGRPALRTACENVLRFHTRGMMVTFGNSASRHSAACM